jgi:hypothetical protein
MLHVLAEYAYTCGSEEEASSDEETTPKVTPVKVIIRTTRRDTGLI